MAALGWKRGGDEVLEVTAKGHCVSLGSNKNVLKCTAVRAAQPY